MDTGLLAFAHCLCEAEGLHSSFVRRADLEILLVHCLDRVTGDLAQNIDHTLLDSLALAILALHHHCVVLALHGAEALVLLDVAEEQTAQ